MKKSNNPYRLLAAACLAASLCACEHTESEPPVNQGYKTNIRVPDPEPLSDEDQQLIDRQQAEYDQNKNKI